MTIILLVQDEIAEEIHVTVFIPSIRFCVPNYIEIFQDMDTFNITKV